MYQQDPTGTESSEKTADTPQSILRHLGELLDTGLDPHASMGTEPPSPDSTGGEFGDTEPASGWAFDGPEAGVTQQEHGAEVRCLLFGVFDTDADAFI